MLVNGSRHDFYTIQYAGCWMTAKYRKQARMTGIQTTARLMRKRGVPLALALRILGGVQ